MTGATFKKKVTAVKHNPAGGIAMPGAITSGKLLPDVSRQPSIFVEQHVEMAHARQLFISPQSALDNKEYKIK